MKIIAWSMTLFTMTTLFFGCVRSEPIAEGSAQARVSSSLPERIDNNLGKTTDQLRADPAFREHVSLALKHFADMHVDHVLKWQEPYSYEVDGNEIRLGFRTTEKTEKHNYIVITIDKKTGKVKTVPRA